MICLKCGYCCLTYLIPIVKDPNKEISDNNILVLDGSVRCPHLQGTKSGEYFCKIHHYEWFKDTPCGQHTQIERENSKCRIGYHKMKI